MKSFQRLRALLTAKAFTCQALAPSVIAHWPDSEKRSVLPPSYGSM